MVVMVGPTDEVLYIVFLQNAPYIYKDHTVVAAGPIDDILYMYLIPI